MRSAVDAFIKAQEGQISPWQYANYTDRQIYLLNNPDKIAAILGVSEAPTEIPDPFVTRRTKEEILALIAAGQAQRPKPRAQSQGRRRK
jgi:hypothetical protein